MESPSYVRSDQQCLQPPSLPHHGAPTTPHPPVERLYSCGHGPLPLSDGRVADSNASPNSPRDLGTGSSQSTTELIPGGTVTSAQNPSSSKNQTRQYWVVAKPRSVLSDIISWLWFYWSTIQDIRQRLEQRPEAVESEDPQRRPQQYSPASVQNREELSTFKICLNKSDEQCATRICKLDTASAVDVMSEAVFSSLGMSKDDWDGPPLMPFGERDSIIPLGKVKVDWHVSQRPRTYTSDFAIVEHSLSKHFDVILGEETIQKVGFYQRNKNVWTLRWGYGHNFDPRP